MTSEATDRSLKTILQMVLMIVETSETKEEAVERIKSLELLREDEPEVQYRRSESEEDVRALRGSNVIAQPGRVGAQKKLPDDPHKEAREKAAKADKGAGGSSSVIEQPGRVGAQKSLPDHGSDGMQTLGDFLRSAAEASKEAQKIAEEKKKEAEAEARKKAAIAAAEKRKAAEKSQNDGQKNGRASLREDQKAEALRRMRALRLLPSIVEDFKKNGSIYMSGDEGMLYFPGQEQLNLVRRFEEANNVLVYHIIEEMKPYGECCTMLYVPAETTGWKSFDKNIQDGLVDAYVYNLSKPDMSEAGLIQVKPVNGGLQRFDVMDYLFK